MLIHMLYTGHFTGHFTSHLAKAIHGTLPIISTSPTITYCLQVTLAISGTPLIITNYH